MPVDQIIYGYVASEESYDDKAVVIEEGSKGKWLYVVLEGQVKVKKRTRKGPVTIETLKEGAIIGEMALFDRGEGIRSASIVADGPTRLGVLDSERLVNEYEALSPHLRGLIRSLVIRLKETTAKASALVLESS